MLSHLLQSQKVLWFKLFIASAIAVTFFELLYIPAALLLGPMFVAIVFSVCGARLRLPRMIFFLGQGMVGAMIAQSLPIDVMDVVLKDWPIFLFGTLSTIFISCFLGWCLSHLSLLPGSTAIWGLSPGAASVMTVICENYGANMHIVAFMQYLRMLCCAVSAALVALYLGVHSKGTSSVHAVFEVHSWVNLAVSLLIALGLPWLNARYFKVSGGAIILPIFTCLAVKMFTPIQIELPLPLLALSYALLGWGIGLRFTRNIIQQVAKLFPYVFAAIVLLLIANAIFAWLLSIVIDIDYLTAFLATSPGGMDSMAIIAVSTTADVSFVMAMQLARFLIVLLLCPYLARFLSRK